jgi:hypothetical protein
MMFIDAREGVSGDMLLAAMLGMLPEDDRSRAMTALSGACSRRGIEMSLSEVEDAGDRGLCIAYVSKSREEAGASRDEAYSALAAIEDEAGSGSPVGRRILDAIMEAEAKAHEVPVDQVHLHEIARPQAMVNIAGIGLVHGLLAGQGKDEWAASPITTGRGMVVVSHGAVRIPAPACRFLLEGMEHVPGDSPGERATPVGVAAVKVLASRQTADIPASPRAKSMGFGTRRFGGRLGRISLLKA